MAGHNSLALGLIVVGIFGLLFTLYLYDILKNKKKNFKENHAFGVAFCVASVMGFIFMIQLYFFEPIPGQYIEVFGVGYAMFSLAMLVEGINLLRGMETTSERYVASLIGVVLLVLAYAISKYNLTKSPTAAIALFTLSGLGAVFFPMIKKKEVLILVMILFFVFGVLAMYMGIMALDGHIASALAPKV